MTYSKGFSWILISFIFGITASLIYHFAQIIILGFLILGFLISFSSFFFDKLRDKKRILIILGFAILFFSLAILRFQEIEFKIKNDPVAALNDKDQEFILVGKIISDPDIRGSYQNLKVKIKDTSSVVLVSTDRHKQYNYLDEVSLIGKLETPNSNGDFNYKNYLMKDGVYSVMVFPEIQIISKEHKYSVLSFLYEKILYLKSKMQDFIKSNYSPPGSFIIEGIILGNDKNMDKELKDKFNSAGLSHVTAVSGSNIVIMVSIIMPILLSLGLWRQQALYFTLLFVWLYIVLVGLPVSAIRAAIMASIFIFSQILGRQNTSSRTLIIAGAVMVFQNPLILFYDIGFQLSFLASMALIYLKPIIDNYFYFLIKKRFNIIDIFKKIKANFFWDIFSTTLSVQIFTLPVIIYNFKSISVIALIANLLIIPIITILTFLSFWSVFFGIFSNFLGWIFYLPSNLILIYFIKVLDVLYQPWARININISMVFLTIYYFIILLFVWIMNKKVNPEFLEY